FTAWPPRRAAVACEAGGPLPLEPLEIRVFRGDKGVRTAAQPAAFRPTAPDAAASERVLRALAQDRVAIERVYPEIDGGRFAVKRIVGDVLEVWADIFADGHDKLQARIKYKPQGQSPWREAPMSFFDNDRWVGRFPLTENTDYLYTVEAWRDLYGSWCADTVKKRDAGRDLRL